MCSPDGKSSASPLETSNPHGSPCTSSELRWDSGELLTGSHPRSQGANPRPIHPTRAQALTFPCLTLRVLLPECLPCLWALSRSKVPVYWHLVGARPVHGPVIFSIIPHPGRPWSVEDGGWKGGKGLGVNDQLRWWVLPRSTTLKVAGWLRSPAVVMGFCGRGRNLAMAMGGGGRQSLR